MWGHAARRKAWRQRRPGRGRLPQMPRRLRGGVRQGPRREALSPRLANRAVPVALQMSKCPIAGLRDAPRSLKRSDLGTQRWLRLRTLQVTSRHACNGRAGAELDAGYTSGAVAGAEMRHRLLVPPLLLLLSGAGAGAGDGSGSGDHGSLPAAGDGSGRSTALAPAAHASLPDSDGAPPSPRPRPACLTAARRCCLCRDGGHARAVRRSGRGRRPEL